MAPPVLRQSASNAVAKGQSRTCTATFDQPTTENSLVVVVAVAGGGYPVHNVGPAGFTFLRSEGTPNLHVTMWYREAAPATRQVSVTSPADRSLSVRAFEYTGARQSGAVDKVTIRVPPHNHNSADVDTGYTGTTVQADQVVLVVIANRYASTVQTGFQGGFARLFENITPQYFGTYGQNADADRCRMTVHQLLAYSIGTFRLLARLSSSREWITFIVTFRGGSAGPARMTSTTAPTMVTANPTANAAAQLSAFGRFTSTAQPAIVDTHGGTGTILPFDYQFQLNGLLVGDGTPYDVVSHDGLYGYEVRTSDDDQPRGDGGLRGVDLQSARVVLFRLAVGGSEQEVEQLLAVLYRALAPQRDLDWSLVWRHPAQPAKLLRCRPIQLPRESAHDATRLAPQSVALRAVDPRHYSAVAKQVEIPNSLADGTLQQVTVTNVGNIAAHPKITLLGPTNISSVTRVELVNSSGLVTFDVRLTLPTGSVLVGDMEARVTGAPRSTIELDGVTKYGSWQLPRTPFRLDPDPYVIDGDNVLYMRTDPPGADVRCILDWRDTWAG